MLRKNIKFYGTTGPHGCFSNFSRHSFFLKGKLWPTTEHYFQAMKFEGTEHEEHIRHLATPGEAARAGRSRSRPLRADWEQVKEQIMLEALGAKFTQHPNAKQVLMDSGDSFLIEDSPIDYYWGIGKSGSGKNRLGFLLMHLRDLFAKETVTCSEK